MYSTPSSRSNGTDSEDSGFHDGVVSKRLRKKPMSAALQPCSTKRRVTFRTPACNSPVAADEHDSAIDPNSPTQPTISSDGAYESSVEPTTEGALASKVETQPLKLSAYWRYSKALSLYHFDTSRLSIRALSNSLTRAKHGYVHTLLGSDPLANVLIDEGDETPSGCIEVVYMPDVFQRTISRGSAVGLRFQNSVVWLCFRGPVIDLLRGVRNGNGKEVMDEVGLVEKQVTGHNRNSEHRSWFASLEKAKLKDVKLKLTWKNKEMDRLAAVAAGELESMAGEQRFGSLGKLLDTAFPLPPPEQEMARQRKWNATEC